MKTRIACLPPGSLEPGMVTAAAVHGKQGQELLSADHELDASLIASLRRRGVPSVRVRLPDPRSPADIARDVAAAEARLASLFRGESNAAREELRQVVTAYRLAQAE